MLLGLGAMVRTIDKDSKVPADAATPPTMANMPPEGTREDHSPVHGLLTAVTVPSDLAVWFVLFVAVVFAREGILFNRIRGLGARTIWHNILMPGTPAPPQASSFDKL